ncbi:MAG: nucleotidyltransferase family protein [Bradymonadia bacterium]
MNWLPLIHQWLWHGAEYAPTIVTPLDAPIHGLRGLLYNLAPAHPEASVNEYARTRNIAHHLTIEHIMSTHWPSHITPPYVFKGLDYALNLYPEIGLRHSNDVDILIAEQHFEPVVTYLTRTMKTRPAPKENRHQTERASAITFEKNGVTLDVHRTPIMEHQTRLRTQTLIDQGQPGRLGTCDALFPDPLNRLFLWLHNFAKNFHPLPLHSLVDLTLILRLLVPDNRSTHWKKLEKLTQRWGLDCPFILALHYLEASTLWRDKLPKLSRKTTHYRIDRWKETLYHTMAKAMLLLDRTIPEGRAALTARFATEMLSRLRAR